MPADLTIFHILAALLLLAAWFGHSLALRLFSRGSLNAQLKIVRKTWIHRVVQRGGNPYDALLIGHTVNSAAFFGSATLLVLAAILSLVANLHAAHPALTQLSFMPKTSVELFALQLIFIAGLLAISFFTFTYTIRKLIYTVVLLGALPDEGDNKHPERDRLISNTATVLGEAVKSFNFGIRGYYYAAAALFIFLSPLACMVATVFISAILLYRQLATRTSAAVGDYVDALKS